MKVKDIPTIINAFGQLGSAEGIPARVSYAIAKNLRKLASSGELYDSMRLAKAKELGKLSEDGKQYLFETEESRQAFTSYMNDLGDTDALIVLHNIRFEEIRDLKIPAPVFFQLMEYITEDQELPNVDSSSSPV